MEMMVQADYDLSPVPAEPASRSAWEVPLVARIDLNAAAISNGSTGDDGVIYVS